MTDREQSLAALGLRGVEGIEQCTFIALPWSGREIRKTKDGRWEVQPWNDNYWLTFDDLLDAVKASKRREG